MDETKGRPEGEVKHSELHCSFCGKNQREIRKLIAGPAVFICDECVRICEQIIKEETNKKEARAAEAVVERPPPPEPPRNEVARRRGLGGLALRLALGCSGEQGLPEILGTVAFCLANTLDPGCYEPPRSPDPKIAT